MKFQRIEMSNAQGQIPETLQGDKTEASTKEYKNKWRPNGDFLPLESCCTKEYKPTQPEEKVTHNGPE